MLKKLFSRLYQNPSTQSLVSPEFQKVLDQVQLDQEEESPVFESEQAQNVPESASPDEATTLDIGL